MDRQTRKLLKVFGGLVATIFLLLGFIVNSQQDRQYLEVDFLDVGQGDAVLIKTQAEQNILIDGGGNNQVLSELGSNLPFFTRDLDLVILTHPHSDHVVGLINVLQRYNVDKVLMTGVLHTSPDYIAFLQEIQKQNIATEIINSQRDIDLGQEVILKILYPWQDYNQQKVEDLNNTSIITKLVYKSTSFLLTGDASEIVETDLLNNKVDVSAQVLKVAHHGSKYSTTLPFLQQVQPQYAVISVGANNGFGHPHLRTLKNLEDNKVIILRTDLLGTIRFLSDGHNLWQKK